jgi:hypothetical protein
MPWSREHRVVAAATRSIDWRSPSGSAITWRRPGRSSSHEELTGPTRALPGRDMSRRACPAKTCPADPCPTRPGPCPAGHVRPRHVRPEPWPAKPARGVAPALPGPSPALRPGPCRPRISRVGEGRLPKRRQVGRERRFVLRRFDRNRHGRRLSPERRKSGRDDRPVGGCRLNARNSVEGGSGRHER